MARKRIRDTISLDTIAAELESRRSLTKGRVSFEEGFRFADFITILAEVHDFPADMPEIDRRNICTDAVFKAATKRLTAARIKAAVARERAKHERRRPVPYVLATSVSLRYSEVLGTVRHRGGTITFSAALPQRFDTSHVQESRLPIAETPAAFAVARVHVRARTITEAFHKASDRLDFVRGLWNLQLNTAWFQWDSDETRPINRVLLGPVHTLHHPDGSRATTMFWYEPFFSTPATVKSPDKRWADISCGVRRIRRAIDSCAHGDALHDVVIRYCRTLDSRDAGSAFVQLWGVLEMLTDTVGGRYDETIRRASYLYKNAVVDRYLLEIMRFRRNRSVHHGEVGSRSREDLVVLHRYTRDLLMFALQSARYFKGIQELGQFLSLPPGKADLERGIALRREALKFKRHVPRASTSSARKRR